MFNLSYLYEQGNQTGCTKYRSEGISPGDVGLIKQTRGDNNLGDKIIAGMSYHCMHAMFKVFCNRKLNVDNKLD